MNKVSFALGILSALLQNSKMKVAESMVYDMPKMLAVQGFYPASGPQRKCKRNKK